MTRLTDSQLVILSAAAQRATHAVLPLPVSLALNKGAATTVIQSLIAKGLIQERPAGPDDDIWRQDGDGRFTLGITNLGLRALGILPDDSGDRAAQRPAELFYEVGSTSSSPKTDKTAQRPQKASTKQEQILTLLRRPEGATIEEIMRTTKWQKHSIRGAISRTVKKKLGLAVSTEKIEGRGQVYRIISSGT